jgi:hypothetical protein
MPLADVKKRSGPPSCDFGHVRLSDADGTGQSGRAAGYGARIVTNGAMVLTGRKRAAKLNGQFIHDCAT